MYFSEIVHLSIHIIFTCWGVSTNNSDLSSYITSISGTVATDLGQGFQISPFVTFSHISYYRLYYRRMQICLGRCQWPNQPWDQWILCTALWKRLVLGVISISSWTGNVMVYGKVKADLTFRSLGKLGDNANDSGHPAFPEADTTRRQLKRRGQLMIWGFFFFLF